MWTVVYGLLGIKWVIAGPVIEEIWAWEGLNRKRNFVKMIPLIVFWVLSKKRNCRAFEGKEIDLYRLRDK